MKIRDYLQGHYDFLVDLSRPDACAACKRPETDHAPDCHREKLRKALEGDLPDV